MIEMEETEMKRILSLLLVLAMLCCGVSAFAEAPAGETFVSPDGVLSIQAPTAQWRALSSPGCWFLIGDESSYILIDHLSNGEKLPDVTVANDAYKAVSQSFVSTPNEVFIVKGLAAEQDDLPAIMNIIGTIKILRFDTKTAVSSTPESCRAFTEQA